MKKLSEFLDSVCEDSDYTYVKLEHLAEIYRQGEMLPLAQIEWNYSLGHFMVKFRIGVSSFDVASLSRDMAVQDSCLNFGEDFLIHPERGYLYGQEATSAFLELIKQNASNQQEQDSFSQASFISTEPIFAYGSRIQGKTKLEKLWDLYDDEF